MLERRSPAELCVRVLDLRRTGPYARAQESCRGLNLAAETLFGWFSPTLKRLQVARLPRVPRPACAFGAESLESGYRVGSVPTTGCSLATESDQIDLLIESMREE